MNTLSLRDFAPHLKTHFRIVEAPGMELELTEVNDHSNAHLEQFSLIFSGPAAPCLMQGTYTLTHTNFTEIVLFLVPIGPEGNSMRYESVFSRFIAGAS